METSQLINTAKALLADGKGILAMDESNSTCNKRFATLGIPQTVEARRAYRELLVTTPRLSECISGIILFDETIRQHTRAGQPFMEVLTHAGIMPGIKVDLGAKPLAGFPGETITEGLDGLRERLVNYRQLGAHFAKWRAVISIDEALPTTACIEANMHALARYAALCQETGLVPIVEPEVLMEGNHPMERCEAVTQHVLEMLFTQLHAQRVVLEGMLLKPNMVLAGKTCPEQPTIEAVAKATVACLRRTVPVAVPGIAFLSGGQSPEVASAHLNAMQTLYGTSTRSETPGRITGKLPWVLTFSFGRAIQQPALTIWDGDDTNRNQAQKALFERAKANTFQDGSVVSNLAVA